MAKVCVFTADGFEEVEGLTVVDLLRRAGEEVLMVSISDNLSVTGSHGIEIKADVFFDDQQAHCTSASEYVATGHVPHGVANEEKPESGN